MAKQVRTSKTPAPCPAALPGHDASRVGIHASVSTCAAALSRNPSDFQFESLRESRSPRCRVQPSRCWPYRRGSGPPTRRRPSAKASRSSAKAGPRLALNPRCRRAARPLWPRAAPPDRRPRSLRALQIKARHAEALSARKPDAIRRKAVSLGLSSEAPASAPAPAAAAVAAAAAPKHTSPAARQGSRKAAVASGAASTQAAAVAAQQRRDKSPLARPPALPDRPPRMYYQELHPGRNLFQKSIDGPKDGRPQSPNVTVKRRGGQTVREQQPHAALPPSLGTNSRAAAEAEQSLDEIFPPPKKSGSADPATRQAARAEAAAQLSAAPAAAGAGAEGRPLADHWQADSWSVLAGEDRSGPLRLEPTDIPKPEVFPYRGAEASLVRRRLPPSAPSHLPPHSASSSAAPEPRRRSLQPRPPHAVPPWPPHPAPRSPADAALAQSSWEEGPRARPRRPLRALRRRARRARRRPLRVRRRPPQRAPRAPRRGVRHLRGGLPLLLAEHAGLGGDGGLPADRGGARPAAQQLPPGDPADVRGADSPRSRALLRSALSSALQPAPPVLTTRRHRLPSQEARKKHSERSAGPVWSVDLSLLAENGLLSWRHDLAGQLFREQQSGAMTPSQLGAMMAVLAKIEADNERKRRFVIGI